MKLCRNVDDPFSNGLKLCRNVDEAFAVCVLEDAVFWLDRGSEQLHVASTWSGGGFGALQAGGDLTAMLMDSRGQQPQRMYLLCHRELLDNVALMLRGTLTSMRMINGASIHNVCT